MTSKSVSITLALGLAAITLGVAPPHALAAHDTGVEEGPPPEVPQIPPIDQPPPPVRIEPTKPGFVSGGFYYSFLLEAGVAPNFDTDANFEVGADWVDGIGMAAGYRAGPVRLEAELGIRDAQVSSLNLGVGNPFPDDNFGGTILSGNMMANLYIESPVALFGRVRPYVGWGHGFSAVNARYTQATCWFAVCELDGYDVVNDWDRARARQFMAGMTISSASPGTEIFVAYRYFETEDLEFTTLNDVDFIQDGMETYTLMIGARIRG